MTTRAESQRSKVLVALDGSPAAATALPWGRLLAAQLGASVEVFHATPDRAPAPAVAESLRAALENHETLEMRTGVDHAATAILDAAAEPAVVLLVLTTHGRQIEPGRGLGRVAEAVIANTARPILLIRPEAAAQEEAPPQALHRLLFPLNGTPTTAAALEPAVELARQLRASVDLLYVGNRERHRPAERGTLRGPRYADRPYYDWPDWARELRDRFYACCGQGPIAVPVQAFFARGEIGAEIARFVAEQGEDAVVLVRRSRLEPGRAPVLRSVLGESLRPILLLSGPPTECEGAALRGSAQPAAESHSVGVGGGA